jgi:hypothetical protein
VGYTIDIANDLFWKNRGIYGGATPNGKFLNSPHVPGRSALPYGTSYEACRNPGPTTLRWRLLWKRICLPFGDLGRADFRA